MTPHRSPLRAAPLFLIATTWWVASACGGTDTSGVGRSNGTGGDLGSGGSAGGETGGAVSGSGAASGAAGAMSTGGVVGSGGRLSTGGAAGAMSTGGIPICPPCAAPPGPNCVGSGPCGCGPYTCTDAGTLPGSCGGQACGTGTACCGPPECGRCVPETSGVFCPDYCEYCSGNYHRRTGSTLCAGPRTALWEANGPDLSPFLVPDCTDAGTHLPRYCCTPSFTPVCP